MSGGKKSGSRHARTADARANCILPRRARPPQAQALECRQLLSGLAATYYDNADFTGTSITRIDAQVNFDWSSGSPDPRIAPDTFSARWTGQVKPSYSEQYTFYLQADAAAQLWVNGQVVADAWTVPNSQQASGKISLAAGQLYDIKVEYRDDTGKANVKLRWSSPSQAQVTIPTSALYPPSTPLNATAPVNLNPSPGIANPRDYGAIGNGIADDSKAIQKAIDALPAFGTLQLEPRTYKLNSGLLITKPLILEGNGALLLSNTSVSPLNRTIRVESALDYTKATAWRENIVAGQSTFHAAVDLQDFQVGQWVFVELGQDPYDLHEQHFTALTPITAVDEGGTISLGISVPYDVNAGTFWNKVTPVSTLATQVHIRNVKIDYVDGTTQDAGIWFERARNSSVDGLSGRFNIGVVAADSKNITVSNFNATLTNGHSAAGRAFSVWQTDSIKLQNATIDTSFDKAVFFAESWARDTQIVNVDVKNRSTIDPPRAALFGLTGGSTGTVADQIRIDNAGPLVLSGGGLYPASFHFGSINVTGRVKYIPLNITDDLTVGTRHYAGLQHVTKTITLIPNARGQMVSFLPGGTVKNLKITASDTRSLTALYVLNASYQGANVITSLVSGNAVELTSFGFMGTDYLFNDPTESAKSVGIYTPSIISQGAKITIDVDYYPAP
jgi:hypothetical protein